MKYVNIKIEGEDEIGVIGFHPPVPVGKTDLQIISHTKLAVEPLLVKALSVHFKCEIKIVFMNVFKENERISMKGRVLIAAEEEDRYEDFEMAETRVY